MPIIFDIFIFIFGVCMGSFLNVCIHRWPREESIVKPGSHCPHCKQPIAWSDNIPLVSFLLLGGKCRHCGKRFSTRYFVVESASGILWLSLWMAYGLSAFFAAGVVLISILLAVTITDIETGYIPDNFTYPGMLAGLALAALFPSLVGEGVWHQGLLRSGIGLLFGGGTLLAIGVFGNLIFRKESMGGGDIKLMAVMGAFLGAKKVLLVLLFAPMLALPFALFMKFIRKAETLPYGPYLALTGAWFYIYGDEITKAFFYF